MNKRWFRTVGIAVLCVCIGAGAGIASGVAKTKKHSTRHQTNARGLRHGGFGFGMRGDFGAVHSESVVLNKAGTGYITVTTDNGTVKSVSGNDVTITEGTTKVPYKDVTVTVPDDATVVRDFKTAKMSDLAAGDHIRVTSSSDGTWVFAVDDSFKPPMGHGPGDGPGGPHGGPWGPTGSTGSTGASGASGPPQRGPNQGPPPGAY